MAGSRFVLVSVFLLIAVAQCNAQPDSYDGYVEHYEEVQPHSEESDGDYSPDEEQQWVVDDLVRDQSHEEQPSEELSEESRGPDVNDDEEEEEEFELEEDSEEENQERREESFFEESYEEEGEPIRGFSEEISAEFEVDDLPDVDEETQATGFSSPLHQPAKSKKNKNCCPKFNIKSYGKSRCPRPCKCDKSCKKRHGADSRCCRNEHGCKVCMTTCQGRTPGRCPNVPYFTKEQLKHTQIACKKDECKCDSECKHIKHQPMKCCRSSCGTLNCMPDACANKHERPGVCPRISKPRNSKKHKRRPGKKCSKKRNRSCACDNECPLNKKCCANKYGRRSCVKVHVPTTKPGECPKVTGHMLPGMTCPSNEPCQYDYMCEGSKKCCLNICGKLACTNPFHHAVPVV